MEGIEIVSLKVCWDGEVGEALDELEKGKKKLIDFLKKNARGGYDKAQTETFFDAQNANTAFRFLCTYIPELQVNFEIVFSGMESGQDVYGKCSWDIDELDEDEDPPDDLTDIVSEDELVYPENWFAEWADDHEDETSEWLTEHKEESDDNYDFGADRWRAFADEFSEAMKEFIETLEEM